MTGVQAGEAPNATLVSAEQVTPLRFRCVRVSACPRSRGRAVLAGSRITRAEGGLRVVLMGKPATTARRRDHDDTWEEETRLLGHGAGLALSGHRASS